MTDFRAGRESTRLVWDILIYARNQGGVSRMTHPCPKDTEISLKGLPLTKSEMV